MNNYKKNRLDSYKKSLESAWGYNDYNDWPIKVNSIMHLFLKEFAQEVVEDIQQIEKENISINKLLNLFGNPARIYRIIDPVIFGMKRMAFPLDFQREIVMKMLDYVNAMKAGSEFNENGRNLILTDKKINDLLNSNRIYAANTTSAEIIQRFCGIMWAYTESVFFRAHEVTKEVHGSYDLGDSRQLVIREYLNLQPIDLWGYRIPFLKYKKIVIYAIYNSKLELKIDSYNHLFLNQGNYKEDMVEYFILADDNPIDLKELEALMKDALFTITDIHGWADTQDWKSIANKYVDIYWYRKRPLREVLHKNASVPDTVRRNILHGEPDPRRQKNLTEKEINRLIRIVI